MAADDKPVPVEIINHTDWWQPYVPPLVGLVGSLIVASAAFAGVVKSNRTNRRSIEAADDRERGKWHRDNLLLLCSELQREARGIIDRCNAIVGLPLRMSTKSTKSTKEEIEGSLLGTEGRNRSATGRIASLVDEILLLDEKDLHRKANEIRNAAKAVNDPMMEYQAYVAANRDQLGAKTTDEERAARRAEIRSSQQDKDYSDAQRILTAAISAFTNAAQATLNPSTSGKRPTTVAPRH